MQNKSLWKSKPMKLSCLDAIMDVDDAGTRMKHWILPIPPRAPECISESVEKKLYWDRAHYTSPDAQIKALEKSSTLYVGNLSFDTRAVQIWSHFSVVGRVQNVILGLDRFKKTPCGFCFVEYGDRKHALAAVSQLTGTKLDGKVIRVELDAGFIPGRQFGRGASGGQVRDDRRAKRARDNTSNYYGSGGSDRNQPPPVSLDSALPSARAQSNDKMDEDNQGDDANAPPHKRQRKD
jgi:nuclear cap-binding protein subunit 2